MLDPLARPVYDLGVPPLLALLGAAGCAEWPRAAHLPAGELDALTPGEPPPPTTEVTWTHLGARADEDDDAPTEVPLEPLAEGEGALLHGTSTGSGWDFAAVAERAATCGQPSAFPTEARGDYLGDVDWRVVEVTGGGRLCSTFAFSDGLTRADVVPFSLDACGVPAAPLTENGLVIGFGAETAENAWEMEVGGGARIALAAAGWAPDAPEATLRYLWGLSLVSMDAETCPELE